MYPDSYEYLEENDHVSMDEHQPYLDAKEWVEELMDHLYVTGDIQALEEALEELASVWNLPIPKAPLKIIKQSSPKPHIIDLSTREKLQAANEAWNKPKE